jgi:hypothetical protein
MDFNSEMYLGYHSSTNGKFHLQDDELNQVSTAGVLRFGDKGSSMVQRIAVAGVSYQHVPSTIFFTSTYANTGEVNFNDAANTFLSVLNIEASKDISVNTKLQSDKVLKLVSASTCSSGGFFMNANGILTTNSQNKDISIWGGAIGLDNKAKIDAGSARITISERCDEYVSVALGGIGSDSASLHLDKTEMGGLTAGLLNIFSEQGEVKIHGYIASTHMPGVSASLIYSAITKLVTFETSDVTFAAGDEIRGDGGITISTGLMIMATGKLTLTHDNGDLTLESSVQIITSVGSLIITSSANHEVLATAPGTIYPAGDLMMTQTMSITRSSTSSSYALKAGGTLTFTKDIAFQSNNEVSHLLKLEAGD